MKCPVCDHEMVQDKHGYECDACERYFTNKVIEYGIFDKEEIIDDNELSQKLDEYIKRLKTEFPDFVYNNTIKDDFDEKTSLPDKFTIIVRGVPRERIKEIHSFIRDVLYSECIDNDEELPNIITLQNPQ